MADELHELSIAALARLIAARRLSPVELVGALIERVEQYDAQTRAFITPTFDLAREQARHAEAELAAGHHRGPLHGIPFGLTDIYDTRGILTSGHSRVFVDRIPREDATATRKLYEAGAVLLGKLATHEMAHAGPSFDRLSLRGGRRWEGTSGSARSVNRAFIAPTLYRAYAPTGRSPSSVSMKRAQAGPTAASRARHHSGVCSRNWTLSGGRWACSVRRCRAGRADAWRRGRDRGRARSS